MGEESKAQSSFPPPPVAYYSSYTDDAVANGTAPKPPAIPSGSYSCFGAPLEVDEEILRPLSSQGIQQLYSSSNTDRISEMRKLNMSIVMSFLDLLAILIQAPSSPKREEKVNDISLLFINLHHLINEYRPHQARETLRVMMDRQRTQRQSAITEMQGHLDKVRTVLARCRPIISGLREQGEGGKEGASAAHGTSGSGMTSSLTGQESTSRKTVGEEAMDTGGDTGSGVSLEPKGKRPCLISTGSNATDQDQPPTPCQERMRRLCDLAEQAVV
ncbi:mediator of RNA polymerase II transcription subunit 7-like [Sycon ciliatum]|uniref:mediator of RNA polymerase II transcription subunit 7-like n=1 Tax=Sycon ciliatum TaxID=27933 RepID=UPI0031F6C94B